MKKMFKLIPIIVVSIVAIFCLCSCNPPEDTDSVETEGRAIYLVENYLSGTDYSTKHRIASALEFNKFYDPEYGLEQAEKLEDGSWKVTIKGNMEGYRDDYHEKLTSSRFTIEATVTSNGSVTISVEEG